MTCTNKPILLLEKEKENMDQLCCPECDHVMTEEEWEKLKDSEGYITCPQCGDEYDFDDLLSNE